MQLRRMLIFSMPVRFRFGGSEIRCTHSWSCVGVCIWDPLMPSAAPPIHAASWDRKELRRPVTAMWLFHIGAEAPGSRRKSRTASRKVFGGGCLFDSMRELNSNKEQHLGSRNVEIALEC